jgi:hypothetical protein
LKQFPSPRTIAADVNFLCHADGIIFHFQKNWSGTPDLWGTEKRREYVQVCSLCQKIAEESSGVPVLRLPGNAWCTEYKNPGQPLADRGGGDGWIGAGHHPGD